MQRLRQITLILSLLAFSWLAMMLVHELGHVLGARAAGGNIQRIVWHPLTFSRTDVDPNPAPLLVVWAGPIVGIILPMVVATALSRRSFNYLFTFFAGFCLFANGAYLGIGVFGRVGDTGVMLRLTTPRWVMIAFGLIAMTVGLWFLHKASDRLGFGRPRKPINTPHTCCTLFAALLLIAIALTFGVPGH